MKKVLLIFTTVILFQTIFVGVAGARYVKEADKTISINSGLNLSIPLNTAEKSFKLQEGVHKSLKTTTGLEIDYYYIWLELDGQTILGIDPARAMF
ncbi:hypothetical protein MHZ92_18650 [Sporosarcina sp. ACRSL]|uniref:hypothetical protein n=1 Tax=Sporosarcina sp. ACRSL TaxID=2918215 RepID=UPI001EF51BA8|nr:hypothetical protein [Sporosarcina sp. ACRSL]MCG7346132.1 hypothetical protein [Sporosarcina sp. ACRSL]